MRSKPSAMRAVPFLIAGLLAVGCGGSDASSDPQPDSGHQDGSAGEGGGCMPDPDAGDAEEDAGDTGTDASEDAAGDTGVDAPPDVAPDHELQDCPADMVPVGAVCVDVYEASRPDATEVDQGTATGPAQSVAGVIPWHVPTMTPEALAAFQAACKAAGKRICEPSDWLAACEGPQANLYVFGDTFDPETCNCVDTFCDDYCADNGIPPGSCVTDANCGYTYGCFRVTPTGSFPDCTNELGTYDVTGNVWEVVPSTADPRGYEVRGGAYNCAGAESRLQCTFNAQWTQLFAGFRCCLDR